MLYFLYVESLDGSRVVFWKNLRISLWCHFGGVAYSAFWLNGQIWYFLCHRYFMKELIKSPVCILYTITILVLCGVFWKIMNLFSWATCGAWEV